MTWHFTRLKCVLCAQQGREITEEANSELCHTMRSWSLNRYTNRGLFVGLGELYSWKDLGWDRAQWTPNRVGGGCEFAVSGVKSNNKLLNCAQIVLLISILKTIEQAPDRSSSCPFPGGGAGGNEVGGDRTTWYCVIPPQPKHSRLVENQSSLVFSIPGWNIPVLMMQAFGILKSEVAVEKLERGGRNVSQMARKQEFQETGVGAVTLKQQACVSQKRQCALSCLTISLIVWVPSLSYSVETLMRGRKSKGKWHCEEPWTTI